MSWELAYLCGLLSGAALAGLIGVFLHARSWSEWSEAFDAMEVTGWDWHNRFAAESKRADDTGRHRDSLHADLLLAAKAAAAMTDELDAIHKADDSVRDILRACMNARDSLATERESLRSQLADTRLSLDAAMAHVEQLVMERDAGIVERDSLLSQVRGLHEAVQAVTDERNDAAARADASNARCQQAVRDRAKAYDGMRGVVKLIESTQKECS